MADAMTAPIAIQCNCGARMRVPAAKAGKRGKCPKCNSVLDIPSASQPDLPTAAAPVVAEDGRIKFACDSCGKSLKVPAEAAGRRVKCPHCSAAVTVPDPNAVDAAEDDMFAGLSVSPSVTPRVYAPPPPPTNIDVSAGRGSSARSAARSAGSGVQLPMGILAHPGIIFVALALLFGGLFAVARSSPDLAPAVGGVLSLFSLGVLIWATVLGFKESAGTGFLVLCLPFYILYFVFSKSDNPYLKAGLGAAIIASVLSRILIAGVQAAEAAAV